MSEKSFVRDINRHKTFNNCNFQQIALRSKTLLKKAVRNKDREALDALIVDIEHSVHLAAGNLSVLLNGSSMINNTLGKYISKAMETLTLAELEYQKLARSKTGNTGGRSEGRFTRS